MGVETGLAFSRPFIYDGLRFAGEPKYVQCMDDDMKNFFECRGVSVCVVHGSSYHAILSYRLPKRQLQVVYDWKTLYGGLGDGLCNVIASEGLSLSESNVRSFGYTGNYTIGRSLHSKVPLSVVTRNDDPQWSSFVLCVMQAVLIAEEIGITQTDSHMVSETFISGATLFGEPFSNMFENVVATIGNYGELYERHVASTVIREGLTLLNNGSTGLLFAMPFGSATNEGPGPLSGGTMEDIMGRGVLRCAVEKGRPGFAHSLSGVTVAGLDVDMCRALAASLFSGSVDLIELIEVRTEAEGYSTLAAGAADVLAGARWTVQNQVMEPTTGQGYAFSQPYFYGPDDPEEALCLATRDDDQQWATFVYWIVSAAFHAEANGINQRLSNAMPEVHLFGPNFLRMLRDPILEFGNYAELYERNVGPYIPRGGRNQINSIRAPGPQFFPIPGLLRKDT